MKRMNHKKIIFWIVSVVLTAALIIGGCAIYVSDYYRADPDAIATFIADNHTSKTVVTEGTIAYGDTDANVGFIFYPGGKVEYTAYEPLMMKLASSGVLCILIEMPFNLAVLDMNAADGIRELYPNIEAWYMGGHSLGGSMAASYIAKHIEEFEGLVLLGSYSTADISGTSLDVLSMFGSQDQVMNHKKYSKYKENLPSDFTEFVIEGGCHAYFGMYGEQKGDGFPSIDVKEQIDITADCIWDFISERGN